MDTNTGVSLASLVQAGEVETQTTRLDKDEKHQLAEDGTPFTITDIQYATDEEFGAFWQLSIILDDKPTTFALGSSDRRDPMMVKLENIVKEQPITDVRLVVTRTRRNQPFYMIAPAE